MTRVHESVAALAGEGTNLWMAAVDRAEAHLRTWQDELPFGRPLSWHAALVRTCLLAGASLRSEQATATGQRPASRAMIGANGSSWSADRPR